MNKTSEAAKTLTEKQEAQLIKILPLLVLKGEVSGYELETTTKVTPRQLSQLVAKGVLSARQGTMVMPIGPYAGQEIGQEFYEVA
jgi:hypothetical protein